MKKITKTITVHSIASKSGEFDASAPNGMKTIDNPIVNVYVGKVGENPKPLTADEAKAIMLKKPEYKNALLQIVDIKTETHLYSIDVDDFVAAAEISDKTEE